MFNCKLQKNFRARKIFSKYIRATNLLFPDLDDIITFNNIIFKCLPALISPDPSFPQSQNNFDATIYTLRKKGKQ